MTDHFEVPEVQAKRLQIAPGGIWEHNGKIYAGVDPGTLGLSVLLRPLTKAEINRIRHINHLAEIEADKREKRI